MIIGGLFTEICLTVVIVIFTVTCPAHSIFESCGCADVSIIVQWIFATAGQVVHVIAIVKNAVIDEIERLPTQVVALAAVRIGYTRFRNGMWVHLLVRIQVAGFAVRGIRVVGVLC